MVISVEKDEPKVTTLKAIISKFSRELCERQITFWPEPLPGQNILEDLRCGLESSQYAFVFLSDVPEDGWMRFQEDAALMHRIEDHDQYIVPVKPHSQSPIPWFLRMYHVLEISVLLKGKRIEQVEVDYLTKADIDVSLMETLITSIDLKAKKSVTEVCVFFSITVGSTLNYSSLCKYGAKFYISFYL